MSLGESSLNNVPAATQYMDANSREVTYLKEHPAMTVLAQLKNLPDFSQVIYAWNIATMEDDKSEGFATHQMVNELERFYNSNPQIEENEDMKLFLKILYINLGRKVISHFAKNGPTPDQRKVAEGFLQYFSGDTSRTFTDLMKNYQTKGGFLAKAA